MKMLKEIKMLESYGKDHNLKTTTLKDLRVVKAVMQNKGLIE